MRLIHYYIPSANLHLSFKDSEKLEQQPSVDQMIPYLQSTEDILYVVLDGPFATTIDISPAENGMYLVEIDSPCEGCSYFREVCSDEIESTIDRAHTIIKYPREHGYQKFVW